MSEQRQMLADAADRLFHDAGESAAEAEKNGWQGALWSRIDESGFPLVLVPEAQGGVGGDWDDALAILQGVGAHQIPLPIGEAILAGRLAAGAGLGLPAGVVTIAVECVGTLTGSGRGARFTGRVRGVPWGRDAATVVTCLEVDDQPHVILLPRAAVAHIQKSSNFSAEPRDGFDFEDTVVEAAPSGAAEASSLLYFAALMRASIMAGALEMALHRSIEYAQQREQFGRSIGQFQAVQQQLAVFGADVAAAVCAVRAACRAASLGDAKFQIAAAKLRANLASGTATATAHQVHAAIGFTREFALRHCTQRLWYWRSEYGNDRFWSEIIGKWVVARGADCFWSDLTARDDRAGSRGVLPR